MMSQPKAIVLLCSGLGSSDAKQSITDSFAVTGLSFRHGQSHQQKLTDAEQVA